MTLTRGVRKSDGHAVDDWARSSRAGADGGGPEVGARATRVRGCRSVSASPSACRSIPHAAARGRCSNKLVGGVRPGAFRRRDSCPPRCVGRRTRFAYALFRAPDSTCRGTAAPGSTMMRLIAAWATSLGQKRSEPIRRRSRPGVNRPDDAARAHAGWHKGAGNPARGGGVGAREDAGPGPDTCKNAWRLAEATNSLSAGLVWQLGDRCGTLRPLPHGCPRARTGQAGLPPAVRGIPTAPIVATPRARLSGSSPGGRPRRCAWLPSL